MRYISAFFRLPYRLKRVHFFIMLLIVIAKQSFYSFSVFRSSHVHIVNVMLYFVPIIFLEMAKKSERQFAVILTTLSCKIFLSVFSPTAPDPIDSAVARIRSDLDSIFSFSRSYRLHVLIPQPSMFWPRLNL